MADTNKSVAAFSNHDHSDCSVDVLALADGQVKNLGLRLTPVRRRTLEILLEEHRALGAYEVLQRLSEDGYGSQPPVAYRALEFLVENGFAHRIRRLNAFTACLHPGESHSPAFFICAECKTVAEVPEQAVKKALQNVARDIGFKIDRMNVEVSGTCPACCEPTT